ncbi:MAG: indolepyruvate ferredoxin oxidoreductase subunit alpha [Proteobacteria bacterium]|nr:indolepyruvate ferredoxin oxidoreductase subunit alpha [Pseudomonadota bacterium]MBU1737130.1 indolepyruvate ferredoxin oxidoreductase subunit alpha [Pseudomonadota bacterium]
MTQQESSPETLWLSGNEALALGAHEATVKVASGYPGTPSTEILENLTGYDNVYTEWAPNEKVGLEVAIGASFAGVRALATMKHVGLNVAADPLFTASYTGVRGGLVIIVADDPTMHSSQNEQDSRNYAWAAKLPMLEPSDPAEAKEYLKQAYEISEEFDTPVLLRSCTRVAHVKGIVASGPITASKVTPGIEKMPAKFVMLPANARQRRLAVAERMEKLALMADHSSLNTIEWGDKKRGIIAAGTSYLYAKEAFPEASFLKLGLVNPLPQSLIKEFASKVKELIVIEDLDPFLETQIKAMGIKCHGKDMIPAIGELTTAVVRTGVSGKAGKTDFAPVELVPRPPNMCAGCPHRGLFYNLNRLKVFVSGDIGCYTLGFLPPLSAMDSCVCMGASIGVAHGMAKALGDEGKGKIVAVLGDSTFIHSGITGLINTVYNKDYSTVIILDNRITAMTGHQPNPASGSTLMGEPANSINFEELCRAIGVKHVRTVNPQNIKETHDALKEEIERDEPSVVITRFPCVLIPEEKKRKKIPLHSNTDNCTGCTACLRIGCPAIHWEPLTAEEVAARGGKKAQKGISRIDEVMCVGCGLCKQLCKFDAIVDGEEKS